MILDMALGLLVSLSIITGIIGSVVGLTICAFDWLTRRGGK